MRGKNETIGWTACPLTVNTVIYHVSLKVCNLYPTLTYKKINVTQKENKFLLLNAN